MEDDDMDPMRSTSVTSCSCGLFSDWSDVGDESGRRGCC